MDSDTDSDRLEPENTGWAGAGELWRRCALIAGHGGSGDPDSYWRRRFLILAGGLAVVGVITWGLSALLGPASPVGAAPGLRASLAARDTLPAAAYGPAWGARPRVASAPAATRRPHAPSPSPAVATATSPSPAVSATKASPASSGACPAGSIVLSLFTSQARYAPGQLPRFDVYAVSTAPATCQLAYGPSAVRVLVTRAGQVLWDSAACQPRGQYPAVTRPIPLPPGVPQVAAITWDRQAGTPGCAAPTTASGTLDAVAMADGRTSSVRTFVLARH